jgi:hypothetical protein
VHQFCPLVCGFLASDTLPGAMQNVGLALLTVLIPVVLFIFSLEKEALFEWDKIVILDKVIEAKNLLISLALIFLPLFFWGYNSPLFQLFLFFVFVGGVIYLVKILFNSYRWIKNDIVQRNHNSVNFRDFLRGKYHEEISNLTDAERETVWILTWRKEISNTVYERSLIKKFTENIDILAEEKNYSLLKRYLENFLAHIDKRALYDGIVYENLFGGLIKWYFLLCDSAKEQDTKNNSVRFEVEIIVSTLIEKCVLSALKKRTSSVLFRKLKKEIEGKDEECVKKLLARSICRVFFDNIADSQEQLDIWGHYFPEEWKITKETQGDKENFISKIWLNEFIQWAQNRIGKTKNEFDKNLDEVSSKLFPSVEPMLWAKILTLLVRPWSGSDRMKSLVEQGTNFGYTGRVLVEFFGSTEKSSKRLHGQDKAQEDSTLELALILFGNEFTKEKLQDYISDLKRLKYAKETQEEARQKYLEAIFEKMLTLRSK